MKILDEFILTLAGILASIFVTIYVTLSIFDWYINWNFMKKCTEEYSQKMPEEDTIKHCKELLKELKAID